MSEERLDRIERLAEANTQAIATLTHQIEANTQAIATLTQKVETISQELRDEVRRWDERFFQLSRDNLNVSRTIIIVAGSAVIFSPLFQSLSPLIQKLVTQFTQGSPIG